MKKSILICILFITIPLISLQNNIFAQSNTKKEVNLRELLNKQIAEAEQKELKQRNENLKKNEIEASGFWNEEHTTQLKIFIMIQGLILALIFVLYFRRKRKQVKYDKYVLKQNVKRLREERIGSVSDSRLVKLRRKLTLIPIRVDDNGRDITNHARKLSISKGELHLAAKIKMLANQNR